MRQLFFLLILLSVSSGSWAHSAKVDSGVVRLMSEKEFGRLIEDLQAQGVSQVIFENRQSGLIRAGLEEESDDSSGDFFLMISFANKDRNFTASIYKQAYNVVEYLSKLRFRVIINLKAGITDLKIALQNSRPTIIVWSSHGSTDAFYTSNVEPVPGEVFQGASSNVYQFILSACEGEKAYANTYAKFVPKTMKFWRWAGETNSLDLASWMRSDKWDAFMNREDVQNQGLKCSNEGSSFKLVTLAGHAIPGKTFSTKNECYQSLFSARNGFICRPLNDGHIATISISVQQASPGQPYDSLDQCNERLKSSWDGKVCRRISAKRVAIVDSTTNLEEDIGFSSMNECVSVLQSKKIL